MRTEDGKRIKSEQLVRYKEIKEKLEGHLGEVEKREPYIKVRYAVSKIFS
jgi:hypothetical protein